MILLKRFLYSLVLLIALLMTLLWLRSPVQAVSWQPPPFRSLDGAFAPTVAFDIALFLENVGTGPEDILIHEGALYTAFEDGRIIKVAVDDILYFISQAAESDLHFTEVANTGGRPLGLKFNQNNELIVADAVKGLLSINSAGDIRVLVDEYDGKKLLFVDHLAIDENGVIWFSDASARFGIHDYVYDFIEASMTGRLLSYDPQTKETKVHLDGLFFANGVTISPKQDFVLVNETGKSRILRYWLKGSKKGQMDVFIDQLPAMPDNIYTSGDLIWVALVSLRAPKIEALAEYPLLRNFIAGLPDVFLQASSNYAFVIALNEQGDLVHSLQSDEGYQVITAAVEYEGNLYLGSLSNQSLAVSPLVLSASEPRKR